MRICASPKLLAQTPPPAPKNLVSNGGFETASRRENLWQGVDSAGYLTGERGQVPVLTLSGAIADTPMPISVSVADMNADGLLDLVTMDILGYLRIFFNGGTTAGAEVHSWRACRDFSHAHGAKRSHDRPGVPQRTAGAQDLHDRHDEIREEGSHRWELPWRGASCAQCRVRAEPRFQTASECFSAGHPDHEGSEQALGKRLCSLHMGLEQRWERTICSWAKVPIRPTTSICSSIKGSGAQPVFDENNRFVLAYGDGLEQLTPAVVDYNGDGAPDLLVAERSGKIAVYLNTGEAGETWRASA